jgi:hypothetical protein
LTEGDYRSISTDNDQVYAFIRETERQRFMVVLNFAKTTAKVTLAGGGGKWIAGTHLTQGDGEPAAGELALKPYEGRVYEVLQGDK